MEKLFVTYEEFGAKGDGVTDDLAAICAAHAHANLHGRPVRTRPDAVYYLGGANLTAVICTDTDWNTSRFLIDDRNVENRQAPIFRIPASGESFSLPLTEIHPGQTSLPLHPDGDCIVRVTSNKLRHFIRYGLNQNNGSDGTDAFILRRDGSLGSDISWDMDEITQVYALPIDSRPLTVSGGIFTTIANQEESRYNYFARGIAVERSNTILEGISHHIEGEIDHGAPYAGFHSIGFTAGVQVVDCFYTGHRIYNTIGSAGKPVSMGSYDINCNRSLGITFRGCRMEDILNNRLWGVFGSNFCKDLLLEDCIFSRVDAHCGVHNYTIRGSRMGWMGINAIGHGLLTVENTTVASRHFLNFREDYGSTWNGDVVIRSCTWQPGLPADAPLTMLAGHNSGQHNFGYTCTMPGQITIDSLLVEDAPEVGRPLAVLGNFNRHLTAENAADFSEPYPLLRTRRLVVKDIRCTSGRGWIPTENPLFLPDLVVES